jgi:hypothetical protein
MTETKPSSTHSSGSASTTPQPAKLDLESTSTVINFPWKPILLRLALSLLVGGLFGYVLRRYEQQGTLDVQQRRGFNAVALMMSTLMGFFLGSLFDLLGATMRWPLLARKLNPPEDSDLLLGIHDTAGAAKLLYAHARRGRWSGTTSMVLALFITSLFARFSVALVGLTFNMEDVDSSVVNDWSSGWLIPSDPHDGLFLSKLPTLL